MDLLQILQSQMSDDLLGQLSVQIGADKSQTAAATNGIFASLVGGLAKKASTENGLASLGAALDRDHDGSALDDIMGLVGGMIQGGNATAGATNGTGILGHVLGEHQETTVRHVSQNSGLNMDQVMKLMPLLAPIVMAVLGKVRSSGGLDLGSIGSILMGSAQNAAQQGGMGDLLGSILGNALGSDQPQSEQQPQASRGGDLFGQILGGIFGK